MDPAETQSQVTRILMDTGKKRTYITEDVARQLNVQPEGKEKLSIYTFGANKPKEIVTPVVTLALKAKEENKVLIKASVVLKISGEIQRKYKLADTLPKTMESSTLGLLIGNDYYNDIMSSEKVKIEEGLYIIKSKFGWVISGRTTNQRNGRHQENIMFIMTHSSSGILYTMHSLTSNGINFTCTTRHRWVLEVGNNWNHATRKDQRRRRCHGTFQKYRSEGGWKMSSNLAMEKWRCQTPRELWTKPWKIEIIIPTPCWRPGIAWKVRQHHQGPTK